MAFPISPEELNLLLFEQSPDGIFIDDGNGNLIEVNTTLCRWMGYSKKEFQGLTISDLVGKEILKTDPLQMDTLKSGKTVVKERSLKCKNGDFLPVELTARNLPDGKILVHVRDITQRSKNAVISNLISETQSLLLHEKELEAIYKLVAEKIHELIKHGVVLTSMLNEATGTFKLVSVAGLGIPLQNLTDMIGFDPLNVEYTLNRMTDHEMELYRSGKLERIEEGIHAFSTRRIPKPLALSIEKLLGIRTVYTMGFVRNGKHLGGMFILSRGDISMFLDSISLIMNQASITINRIKAEKALHESEEKYRQIAENTSDVIWMMDMNLQYTYVSPSIFRQRGFTPEEFLKLQPEEIFSEASYKKILKAYSDHMEGYKKGLITRDVNMTLELEHKCKDGTLRTTEVLLKPMFNKGNEMIGIHGVSRDISERRQNEEKIREMEERFRLAFQTSPDAININRLSDGLYIDVNDGFTRLTQYASGEVIGKTSGEINIWADVHDREELVRQLVKNGTVINFEAGFRFMDGTIHAGLMSATLTRLKGIPHIISITRDIEEIKKAADELRQAKENAEESSRLKTAFLNNISHEVRTPMNAILGFTSLLQSEDCTREEKDRYFGIVNSNSRQLLSIIDDVLEISRMDSGKILVNPSSFSLHELMVDIHLSMSELTKNKLVKILFRDNGNSSDDNITADHEKIRQVITGLIANAIKYTPSGEITFGYSNKKERVEFYVKDTGIGIDPSEFHKIFERFYQAKRVNHDETRGTGLGLSIAKGLVEMMGGEISVDSAPGQGSVFTFTVPLAEVDQKFPGRDETSYLNK